MDLRGIEPHNGHKSPCKIKVSGALISTGTTRGQTQYIDKEENSEHLLTLKQTQIEQVEQKHTIDDDEEWGADTYNPMKVTNTE